MTTDPIALFEQGYQEFHDISPERRKQQLQLLRRFEAGLGERSILETTGDDLATLANALKAEGYHVNTVRKKLNMIRPFFSWAYATRRIDAERYTEIRQVKNPRGSTGRSKPDPYTKAELQLFWKTWDLRFPALPTEGRGRDSFKRWQEGKSGWNGRLYRYAMRLQVNAMVHLALDVGLRREEIFNLSMDDLHYDNEYIVIYGKADAQTGQKKVRSVPFTTDAREAVREWLEFRALMRPDHDRPWLSCWAQSFRNPMWYTRFKELLQVTVDRPYRWHRFRHTCATNWLRSGVELEVVSILLGHANIQQTLGYAQIVRGDIAKAMAKGELRFDELRGKAA